MSRITTAIIAAVITTTALTGATAVTPGTTGQRCQYDVAGRTLIVLPSPHTPVGTAVTVQRTAWSPHHWHRAGRIDSRRVVTIRLRRPASQFTLRVRVGGHRCETT